MVRWIFQRKKLFVWQGYWQRNIRIRPASDGNPKLQHPYSFTLLECEYLREWFDSSDKIVIDLEDIPDDQISFTLGDSCALMIHGNEPIVLTKKNLLERIEACNGSVEEFFKESLGQYAYVEAQLWDRIQQGNTMQVY